MHYHPLHVAVVGSGMISDIYLKNMIERFPILSVEAICSAHMENAEKKARKYGIAARTFEDILADSFIDMIVNLTPAPAHEEIIRRALHAGKHVHTEKTMTMNYRTARGLVELAKERGLYLGSAPDTFMGAALQTVRKAIDDGLLGEINSFAIASNRNNSLMTSFYRFLNLPGGGVGYDYAVYYLTALVSILGPVAQVAASVRNPYPVHIDVNPAYETYGKEISTPNESEIMGIIKMRSGATGTIHFNNDSVTEDQSIFTIYGTKGMLWVPCPNFFGGEVRFKATSDNFDVDPEIEVLNYGFPYGENSRGIGPAEMAMAIREGRPNRASADMACHVLEVIDAIMESGEKHVFVDIDSTCERPEALHLTMK